MMTEKILIYDKGEIKIGGGIAGAGEIIKRDAGKLLINGDSSYYKGALSQDCGTTTVSAIGKMFTGTNTIKTGTLEIHGDGISYSVILEKDGVLERYTTEYSK
ncbi:MAG: hypothetical protein LBS81_04715 [Endomicrobium sp.]|jgi:hypothetical protein|nr:hypothetical protein [Endomicrobium sp.]